MASFEILEHTADVGIRAEGATLGEVFEQAGLGVADIMGISAAGPGETVAIAIEAADAGALLVDWLSEILWLHETRDALLVRIQATDVSETTARGHVEFVPRADQVIEGTQVKAITYHELRVERIESGWVARVFLDV